MLCWLNGRIGKENIHKYFHLYSMFIIREVAFFTLCHKTEFRDKFLKLILVKFKREHHEVL